MDDLMAATAGRCLVFWADTSVVDAGWWSVLSPIELERAAGFRRPADRDRFVLGAALLRQAVAAATGIDATQVPVVRSCAWCGMPHGRPTLVGAAAGWHVSVTHSGSAVGVALTRAGAVGLDVEAIGDLDYPPLLESALAADEAPPDDVPAFLAYWTRKESVLKATGEGLTRAMSEVVVSAPADPPRLITYAGRATAATLFDLSPAAGFASALTVLTDAPVEVDQHRVADLGWPGRRASTAA